MSLQGSLETIALPDVLSLLASNSKTGELRVTGRVDGQLWLQNGKLVASRVGVAPDHVEAVFQLLRLSGGDFLFTEGSSPAEPGEASLVMEVVRQAEEWLTEWKVIEAVIPSVDMLARLRSELPGPEVTVPAEQWRMVAALLSGMPVRETLAKLELGEFEGCRRLKELVDAGLVTIEAPEVPTVSVSADEARPLSALSAVVVEHPEPEENHRPAGDDVGSAAVAMQTTSPRLRPHRLTAPALDAALAAAAKASTDAGPTPGSETNGARRPRRVATTRDDVLSARARPGRLEIAEPVAPHDTPAVEDTVATSPAEGSPQPHQTNESPGEEPINRGLLLKFLSSVRS